MPKATVRRFSVVARESVAREMFRYDRATVISKTFHSCDDGWVGSDLEEVYTRWLFVFEMECEPTYKRWQSFGVGPKRFEDV